MSEAVASTKPRKIVATVPPQEILPITNANYESSVRGIYVIGDVTGDAASQRLLDDIRKGNLFPVPSNPPETRSGRFAVTWAGPLSPALEA